MSPALATTPESPTTSRGSLGVIPPPTVTAELSNVFAFNPPFRPEDLRQQTCSSASTVPPVMTPPTGVPLGELASFNGYRPTWNPPPTATLNSVPSTPGFAFQPPSLTLIDRYASYSRAQSRATSSCGYQPPSDPHSPATPESHLNSKELKSINGPNLISEGVQRERPGVGMRGREHVAPSPHSSILVDNLAIEQEYDFNKEFDTCDSHRSNYDAVLKAQFSLPSNSNVASRSELCPDDEEDSPYPEVRASVSNTDDVDIPCLTFRVWFIGIILCAIASAGSIVFDIRNGPYFSPLLVLLFAHPCGRTLAWLLPIRSWTVPYKLPFVGGWEFSLNPSPWSIKEHAMVFFMSDPAMGSNYGLEVISILEKRYHIKVSFGFSLLIGLSTHLPGIGLAGLFRRALICPAYFIWPTSLVFCAVLNTLHAGEALIDGLSRLRFFTYATLAAYLYYFLPGFLFTSLSYFSFVCWLQPHNPVVNQLFGTVTGFGMSVLTFDWSQIAAIGSPLMYPFWSQLNIITGFVVFHWIISPTLYYSDVWKTGHLPVSGFGAYDRFAKPYNTSRIFTSDHRFDASAYEEYSPLYLPITFAVTYFLGFMLPGALVVHTALHYGPEALRRLKGASEESDDIHARLMTRYPEAPMWYYWAIVVVCTVMMIVAVDVGDIGVPTWGPLLAMLMTMIYCLPMGYMLAMTGVVPSINVITQVIAGCLFPGSAVANMIFKAFVVQSSTSMVNTSLALKMAHYIKCGSIPVLYVQLVGGLVGLSSQMLVRGILWHYIPDMCDPNQRSGFTCPGTSVMYTASIIWGGIGPARQFGNGSIYSILPYAVVVGAILPVPIWLWVKRRPRSKLRYVHLPLVMAGPTYIPPASGINYSSWFLVGTLFGYCTRNRNFRRWSRYNYVLSAALDLGTIMGAFTVFFALQIPKSGSIRLDWWGNTIWQKTADFTGVPFYGTDPVKGF